MEVASKTRQIGFFCYHNHAIRFAYCGSDYLFVKWSKCAQIDHIDSSTIALDTICGSRARLQYHRAPANNSDVSRSVANTHTTGFTYWKSVISVRNIPVFGHNFYHIALTVFRWLGTIEASAF